jgi:hypothetical protein
MHKTLVTRDARKRIDDGLENALQAVLSAEHDQYCDQRNGDQAYDQPVFHGAGAALLPSNVTQFRPHESTTPEKPRAADRPRG